MKLDCEDGLMKMATSYDRMETSMTWLGLDGAWHALSCRWCFTYCVCDGGTRVRPGLLLKDVRVYQARHGASRLLYRTSCAGNAFGRGRVDLATCEV